MENKEITLESLINNIKCISLEEKSRSWAWVDCNKEFGKFDTSQKEYLAKELFRYLANWGMLRGDAFLAKYNWRILISTVEILLREENKSLYNLEISGIEKNADKIISLGNKIDEDLRKYHDNKAISKILITKILLGSLGCSVAYDTNVTETLRKFNNNSDINISANFSEQSILEFCNFYKKNETAFEKERQRIKEEKGEKFPPMRILDMAFCIDDDK